jgi:branched-chain amino acid transport system substrate-binding protein
MAFTYTLRALAFAAGLFCVATQVHAQKKYDTGASDTEIKIGQTMPYSGPASAYATVGKASAAYFEKINAEGGVNGRKITMLSLDDGYSPPKTVEQVRKLVEQEQVLLLFGTLGTPTNSAIHKYVNSKKIPHLFLNTGATKWNDPKNFPWTMGYNLSYQAEGRIYAKYLMQTKPNAKIAILYQNDDYGKDYVKGLKDGLGEKAKTMVVAETSYEVAEPSIDSQIIKLQSSGADTFFNVTTPKFAAQAIRKSHDLGWKPLHILNQVSSSVGAVLTPAGLDKSVGLITAAPYKDAVDPQWKDDAAMKEYLAFMKRYYPSADVSDVYNVVGYTTAQLLVHTLKQAGDNLTRENVMNQARNIKDLALPMLLPGMKINTSLDDHSVLSQAQLAKFDGKEWKLFGDVIGGK